MALVDDLARAFQNAGMDPSFARLAAAGLSATHAHTVLAALTVADASVIDTVYGTEEAAVIGNLRTRVGEIESRLRTLGFIP